METTKLRVPALEIEPLQCGEGNAAYAFGNVILFLSNSTPDLKYLNACVDSVNAFARSHARKLGVLIVISASERPPDDKARRALQSAYTAIKKNVRAGVLVVEGQGFLASAKRSVITLFNSSAPFPMRVSSTLEEGARVIVNLLESEIDPRLDVEQLTAAAAAARGQL